MFRAFSGRCRSSTTWKVLKDVRISEASRLHKFYLNQEEKILNTHLLKKIGSRYFIDERVLSLGKHAVFGGDTIVRIR